MKSSLKGKLGRALLIYILFCFVIRLVEAVYDASFSFVSDAIIVLSFAIYIIRKDLKLNITYALMFSFFVVFAHWFCTVFTGGLAEALGYGRIVVIFFLYIIIFYSVMKANLSERYMVYYKWIALILKINIVFIVGEMVAQMMGYGGLLNQFIPKYRILPSILVNNLLGIDLSRFSAPNSMVFEAQGASTISLMGMLFFAPILRNERFTRESYVWLPLAVICFFVSATFTSVINLVICVILLTYFLKNSKMGKMRYKIIVALFLIWLSYDWRTLFFYKFDSKTAEAGLEYVLEAYWYIFLDPFSAMSGFSMGDLLYGVGSGYFFSDLRNMEHGDFGIAVLMISQGILIVGFGVMLYFVYSINLVRNVNRFTETYEVVDNMITRNYLCTLPAVTGLIHYLILFYPGMIQFVSFLIAFSCVLMTYKRNKKDTVALI